MAGSSPEQKCSAETEKMVRPLGQSSGAQARRTGCEGLQDPVAWTCSPGAPSGLLEDVVYTLS